MGGGARATASRSLSSLEQNLKVPSGFPVLQTYLQAPSRLCGDVAPVQFPGLAGR